MHLLREFFSLGNGPRPLEGQPAPEFELSDQEGRGRSLREFRGRWVVLYFYPKDDTPGCTKQACSFRDRRADFESRGAVVVGVSVDRPESHARFAERYGLNFILLADPEGRAAKDYGSLVNLVLVKLARRNTFLIGPDGILRRCYWGVDPRMNAEEMLRDLERLKSGESAD